MNTQNEEYLNFKESSVFVGYEETETKAKIIGIFENALVLDVEFPRLLSFSLNSYLIINSLCLQYTFTDYLQPISALCITS